MHFVVHARMEKIIKSSFKSKDIVSTSRPLELLHIDLFEPVSTTSIYRSKYGSVIVDDYSRWTWVKFLRITLEAHNEEASDEAQDGSQQAT